MAQFRDTADLLDSILRRSGEPTNGNSDLEADALEYLNRIHHTVIAGGNEFDVEVDEPWIWARAKRPFVLELQPAHDTGTVSLTQGSESGTFSSAPAASLEGWFLRCSGRDTLYKIAQHTAGQTAFELDGAYAEDTGAAQNYKAFKLDYLIEPSYLVIDSSNNKLQFEETVATPLTATLTAGSYTPSQLATQIQTQLDAAGASTHTVSYSSLTKKFTLASDRSGGGNTFKLLFATGSAVATSAHKLLGFDDLDYADAASQAGAYAINGISRMIEPFRIYGTPNYAGNIESTDPLTLQRRFPILWADEGLPEYFAKVAETADGQVTVRFNRYPKDKMRIEVEYIPVPRDLQDNTVSVPLFPRKYSEILEYGTAFYLLLDKEDGKAQGYSALAKAKLSAMRRQNRAELDRTSHDLGKIIPRADLFDQSRQWLRFGEPEDN